MPKRKPDFYADRREAILDFVALENGATTRAVAEHLGITSQGAYRFLVLLEKEGEICKGEIHLPRISPQGPAGPVIQVGWFLE